MAEDEAAESGLALERAYHDALKPLTAQQRVFVRAYLIKLNAADAARAAGYSERSAKQQGARLMTKADLSRAIAAGMKLRERRLDLDADWVLNRLREQVDQSMSAMPVFNARGELIEGIWQYDSIGAIKATELIGKHIKMFEQKGSIPLEQVQKLMGQMGLAVMAAIEESIPDENLRAQVIRSVDRKWEELDSK